VKKPVKSVMAHCVGVKSCKDLFCSQSVTFIVSLTSCPIYIIMAKKMYSSCMVTSGGHEHLPSMSSVSKY
jgi:hypothetical protein